jgi:predicted nucleic acid-binding protein
LRRIVIKMGTNAVRHDATAETVSANVKRLRLDQNLGLRGLAKKLKEVNRPLTHSAIDQIEKGARRVDVDDLMALAVALEVSPATLLTPMGGDDELVDATAVGRLTVRELRRRITDTDSELAETVEDLRRRVNRIEAGAALNVSVDPTAAGEVTRGNS